VFIVENRLPAAALSLALLIIRLFRDRGITYCYPWNAIGVWGTQVQSFGCRVSSGQLRKPPRGSGAAGRLQERRDPIAPARRKSGKPRRPFDWMLLREGSMSVTGGNRKCGIDAIRGLYWNSTALVFPDANQSVRSKVSASLG
jgi:hypothetical protein